MHELHITHLAAHCTVQTGLAESRVLEVVATPDTSMINGGHYPPGQKFACDGLTVVISHDLSILMVPWYLAQGCGAGRSPLVELELAT